MSLSEIPQSVRRESQQADPETVFEPGQLRGARLALRYCETVGHDIADYSRLHHRLDNQLVLTKKDRRQLQKALNQYWKEWDRMDSGDRTVVAWARRDVWNAYRPPEGDSL